MKRAAIVVVLGGVVLLVAAARHHGHAPMFPHYRRTVREDLHSAVVHATKLDPRGMALVADREPMPKMTPPSLAAYRSAIATGDGHPGATSFRADTDAYCDYNEQALEEQARKEGITVGEVRELTFFGFAAMRTSQVGTIERTIGRKLDAHEQTELARTLESENQDFTASMRKLVDDGASEEERWEAIRAFEEDYQRQLETMFGLTSAQFDAMLAPDGDPYRGAPVPIAQPVTTPSPEPPHTPAAADPTGTTKPPPGPALRPTPLPGGRS